MGKEQTNMMKLGVQTHNIVEDVCPQDGFAMIRRAGFGCADFSLNRYLKNADIYGAKINHFFSRPVQELENFFRPHKQGAAAEGITVNQMHMPYPLYVPGGDRETNDYLREVVAAKSMAVCAFFQCPYIVVHGFKLARLLGSEGKEWEQTELFLDTLAPLAKEMGITVCIENLYDSIGDHLVEGPCCYAVKAAERIDRINDRYHAEVLGFCFDTGHANLIGLDPEHFITMLGHRLKVLHIHDNDGRQDLHQLPFTFTASRENKSSTDWEGLTRGLRSIRFDGTLSFETAPVLSAFPEGMKETVLWFIAQIGSHFAEKING